MLKQRIEQDLKNAMLGGDKQRVSTLRVVKSAILYAEVAKGKRDTGLSDAEITDILSREVKKRQETAELYQKAGESDRARAELAEKAIIDSYLPEQLSDAELERVVQEAIRSTGAVSAQQMGQVIGEVKKQVGASADGGRIARFVKGKAYKLMIVLMGVAGAGKSMQGKMLADEHGYAWISTGEILRVLVTGRRRQEMLQGKLLSDDEMIAILDKVFELIDTDQEFVLDGFPRTVVQADWLFKQTRDSRFKLSGVIHLSASEEVVRKRLESRGRPDDTDDAISKRFQEYNSVTVPIIDHFKRLGVQVCDIDASRPPREVHDAILKCVD